MAGNINDLIKDLRTMASNSDEADTWLLNKLASDVLRDVKKTTPVDTGDLKDDWAMDVNSKEAYVHNNMDYAQHVEFGHRKRGGNGYVEGRFMLRDAKDKARGSMDRYANGYWRKLRGR